MNKPIPSVLEAIKSALEQNEQLLYDLANIEKVEELRFPGAHGMSSIAGLSFTLQDGTTVWLTCAVMP